MLIAISGGIGSGKSIVARMLEAIGYPVYDCDSRARVLIDNSYTIKESISAEMGECCIASDGTLDRKKVGDIVFRDCDKLAKLNAITHSAVRSDLYAWAKEQSQALKFVETAILYQSEIDRMVDGVIEVTAPLDVRVERIRLRNNLEYEDIIRRIEAQSIIVENPHPHIFVLNNDNIQPMLPQLLAILKSICRALDGEVVGIIAKG